MSEENLKPAQPGEIKNPKGSNQYSNDFGRLVLRKLFENPERGDALANQVADSLINEAAKGNIQALSLIAQMSTNKKGQ